MVYTCPFLFIEVKVCNAFYLTYCLLMSKYLSSSIPNQCHSDVRLHRANHINKCPTNNCNTLPTRDHVISNHPTKCDVLPRRSHVNKQSSHKQLNRTELIPWAVIPQTTAARSLDGREWSVSRSGRVTFEEWACSLIGLWVGPKTGIDAVANREVPDHSGNRTWPSDP